MGGKDRVIDEHSEGGEILLYEMEMEVEVGYEYTLLLSLFLVLSPILLLGGIYGG